MNDKSPGAVKCANEHVYYGVACGPCPVCGWHDNLTPVQLKKFGRVNIIFSPAKLVAIERGQEREISFLATTLARGCYVPHGGDGAMLTALVHCAAHFFDRIEDLQERIMTESRK